MFTRPEGRRAELVLLGKGAASGAEQFAVSYREDAYIPSPSDQRVCGSVVSSSSGTWGRVSAENGFQCFLSITECLLLRCFKLN